MSLYNRVDSQHVGTKVAERIVPNQIYKRIAPRFSDTVTYKHSDINKAIYDKYLKEMHVWFLDQSFTDFGVVRELLKISEKATDAVGQ